MSRFTLSETECSDLKAGLLLATQDNPYHKLNHRWIRLLGLMEEFLQEQADRASDVTE